MDTAGSSLSVVVNMIDLIKHQDQTKGEVLAKNQKSLYELKREISISSKKNFTLERDIRNLDKKIALLIRNRITLEEVMQSSGDPTEAASRTTTLKDKKEREYYGQLFHLLQRETTYIALLARLVKVGEIDNLLQTVMFTLYGNQYEENEEHLLLSMFQTVLQSEFEEATGLGSLLRANTALTRMMTTYTRRGPGQQYLKQTLAPALQSITDQKDLCLEISPSKVYDQYVIDYETQTGKTCPIRDLKPEAEAAAAIPEIQAIIQPRLKKLEEISTQFVDAIVGSVESVPYGIRWICKQIRELIKVKFPTANRTQTCSLIGGFFLLRFVNPAVVTPQAFMLVDSKLSNNTRRNLTLLAKILQNLANNIQFGGVKEFFMEPLNKFLISCREKLNDFLENLCRVENLNDHLQLDKYIMLGKTSEVCINISLNEMYFVHSLLIQHLDLLSPKSSAPVDGDPLRAILNDLGPAPAQLPRTENANVELKLIPRFEANDTAMRPERMYNETKYLVLSLLRVLPQLPPSIDTSNVKMTLETVAQHAQNTRDPELVEKSKKVLHNCKKLVSDGLLSEVDNYDQLRRDIVAELLNYESQIAKANLDLDRLKQVKGSIQQHNVFLQQQLQAYEEYLANVRANCGTSSSTLLVSGKEETKSKKKSDQKGKKGPVKFSHQQLEKDGVIMTSEVPEERRGNIFFSFSSASPGIFDVVVMYKSRVINELKLQLDELLERQHNNQIEMETDFLKLNVNLLVYLLNKTFIS